MPETPNNVNKQIYVSKENLQKVLEFLKTQNENLYLRKGAEAASAAKVKNALTLTVGDTDVVFNGSEAKSTAVAAKVHNHTASNISDFDGAVKKVVFGNQNTQGTVTAHKHDNLDALNKISDTYISDWNAKIGVNDVAKLKYANDAMTGVADVKTAIDVLVKNVQIGSAAISAAAANVNGLADRLTTAESDIATLKTTVGDASSGLVKDVADLKTSVGNNTNDIADLKAANAEGGTIAQGIADAKKAADDAQKAADAAAAAVVTEKGRAEGEEAKLKASIDAINDGTTGILKQAQNYADSKDTEIKNTIGTIAEGKTVAGLIAEAQKQADKGVANAAAEATRAQGVEAGLRADLGQKSDPAAADGSAFARIAQLKADLSTEATTARAAEQAALKAGQDAQKDVDALEAKVGDAADTADDATVYGAIAAEKARAEGKEGEIKAIADKNKTDIATLNANKETVGSVDYKIDQAISNVNTTTEGLAGRVGALETKVGSADDAAKADGSLYARVAKNVADIDAIEKDYLKAADKTELANAIKTEKDRLDAFMADADVSAKAVDTLKEIQEYITKDGEAAATMTTNIANNKAAIDAINNKDTGILATAKKYADDQDAAQKTTLETAISTAKTEAIEAAAADATSKVNTAKSALETEINKKANQTALQDEIDRAKGAEQANANAIATLNGGVNTEGSVAKAVNDAKTALTAEINKKADTETLNAKVEELKAADTKLSERIAKFEGDGAGSVAAQVKAVKDELDAHKTAQATKEKQVDDKLAVIQGEANVEGSIKKALKDAKDYTDTKESAINGLLGTKEDAATVDTAFGRIAKEAARATAAEEALADRATALETKVGDSTKGLVKDVADLKTTVGNAQSGLVKDVADLKAIDADSRLTTAETNITNIQNILNNLVPLKDDELMAMLNQVYNVNNNA